MIATSDVGATANGDGTDPGVIEQEIEATRAEMSQTIDAIQQRLDPEVVSEQAKDVARVASEEAKEVIKFAIDEAKGAVRELADQATSTVRDATIGRAEKMTAQARGSAQQMQGGLMSSIKSNPIPAALVTAGLGWMWARRGTGGEQVQYGYGQGSSQGSGWSGYSGGYSGGYSSTSGYGFPSGEYGEQEGSSGIGQVAGQVQERAGQLKGQVGSQAEQLKGQVGQQAGQVQQQAQGLWQMIEANPIAMGAAGLLLGGIAALLIPETEQERSLLSESRDRVVGSVQQVAGQTVEKVQRVAQEAGHAAMDEAESQGLMASGSGASATA